MLTWLQKSLRRSLPISAGIAVAIICGLAVTTTVFSGVVSWVSEKDASAINTAGSVRMATYRIGSELTQHALSQKPKTLTPSPDENLTLKHLIDDIEQRLQKLTRYQHERFNQNAEVDTALKRLHTRWQTELKPLVLSQNVISYNRYADSYVHEVDTFVSTLQERSEDRQHLQQRIQALALIIIFLVMVFGLFELSQGVLRPLDRLLQATFEFEKGNFSSRIPHSGYQEFANLANRFNEMADTITQAQQSLEQRVLDKTNYLTQANQMLNLLFLSSHKLSNEPVTLERLEQLVTHFQAHFPHISMSLELSDAQLEDQQSIVNTERVTNQQAQKQSSNTQTYFVKHYPIEYQGERYGQLSIHANEGRLLPPRDLVQSDTDKGRNDYLQMHQKIVQDELFTGLTHLIGTALSLKNLREKQNHVILLQERNTIARELHDSLAQSLSYLKIQVAVLEKQLSRDASRDDILQITDDLKNGLNNSYRQLREILTTFRLQLNADSDSFDHAIADAGTEFSNNGGFRTEITHTLDSSILTAREKVHVLHIIREALSNCARHAQANLVQVSLTQQEQRVSVSVGDDGKGLPDNYDTNQHHGLLIMQERAIALGTELKINQAHPHGTIINFCFVPQFFAKKFTEYKPIG